jgi:superfamily II DNA or RNA helicase
MDETLVQKKMSIYLAYSGLQQKDYQLEGVQWCVNNETRDITKSSHLGDSLGGIVADEMGLGKTIIMIGTFVTNVLPNTLIVLPPALIEQWRHQIKRTTGYEPLVFYGRNKKNIDITQLVASRIVICSYAAISVKVEKKKREGIVGGGEGKQTKKENSILHQVNWSRVVFDEAHHLRNKGSAFNGACMLKANIRWLVTGTPIQNKKQDLYRLCMVLRLNKNFYTQFELVRQVASSFIMKRTKKQVGIQMTDVQNDKKLVSWVNRQELEICEEIHANTKFSGVSSNPNSLTIKNITFGHEFVKILRARQSCIMTQMLVPCLSPDETEYYGSALTSRSSKIDAVIDSILLNKDNGNGKLVFCNFNAEIDAIYTGLLDGGMSQVVKIDGRTTKSVRVAAMTEKNEVLILQIQTGCEGLNLQENYSEIYFVSPHWNPSVEDQAVARCHRIGQTKDVFVYRFQMHEFEELGLVTPIVNIEEYIHNVQEKKRFISKQILS